MIAHEDVLAMNATIVVPPAFGFLDGLAFGVVVGSEGNVVFLQITQDALLSIGYNVIVFHWVKYNKNLNKPF